MVCTRSSAKRRESGKVDDGQEGLSGGEPATPTPTQQVPRESLSHQPPGGPSPSGSLPSKDNLSASARNDPQDLTIPGEADLNNAILKQVIDKMCLLQADRMGFIPGGSAVEWFSWNFDAFARAIMIPTELSPQSLRQPHTVIKDCIGVMANHFTTTWEQLTPEEQKKLKSWAPNAEHLIKSDRGRSALFQAWLWHILDDNIFSAEHYSRKWQGMGDKMAIWNLLGQSMSILQELDTRDDNTWPVKYQLWRSLFAQLAFEWTKTTIPEEHVRKVVTAELGHLIDWSKPYLSEDYWDLLQDGVHGFDQILMCTRAKLTLRWGKPIGFPFNSSLGDEGATPPMALFQLLEHGYWRAAENEGKPVEVVMAPAIEAIGACVSHFDTVLRRQRHWPAPMIVAVYLPAEDAGERSAGVGVASGESSASPGEASGIAGEAA